MRFLSPEWVAAYNEVLQGIDLASLGQVGPESTGSLAASNGAIRVVLAVHGGPDGDSSVVRAAFVAADGRLRLELEDRDDPAPEPPNVTVALDLEVAAALALGVIDPTEALGRGQILVRGDLSVLVANQALLTTAAGALGDLHERTTFA